MDEMLLQLQYGDHSQQLLQGTHGPLWKSTAPGIYADAHSCPTRGKDVWPSRKSDWTPQECLAVHTDRRITFRGDSLANIENRGISFEVSRGGAARSLRLLPHTGRGWKWICFRRAFPRGPDHSLCLWNTPQARARVLRPIQWMTDITFFYE